jgi:cell fate regulator YaaT (PSP1 superfamily)
MLTPHLVRVGVLGQVGRFAPVSLTAFPRGTRVVCRTSRGLELGEVLAVEQTNGGHRRATDGELLRRVTVADELLAARLERRKDEAFAACQRLLAERRIAATLVDVEHLFDGQSVYFYFLGTPPAECEPVTEELARTYGAAARFEQFAEALELGCGPDCGTEAGAGCGSAGGCSTCSLVAACAKH